MAWVGGRINETFAAAARETVLRAAALHLRAFDKSENAFSDHEMVNELLEKELCRFSSADTSHEVRVTEKADALPCWDRTFMNSVEAIGGSFEREADSPIE